MTRSTVLALRLVPAPAEAGPVQEPFPDLQLDRFPPDADRREPGGVGSTALARAGRGPGRAGLLRLVGARASGERGMATAEYAVGLVAACAFALVLYKLVNSTPILTLLNDLATRALTFVG